MKKKAIKVGISFIFSVMVLSAIAVHIKSIEGDHISFLDGFYWVITTMTTVGYGDIVMKSDIGKAFSIVVQLYGIIFMFGIAFPYLLIPWVEKRFLISLPEEVELSRHIVIFGFTKTTPFLCKELERIGLRYVIVESEKERAVEALERGFNVIYSKTSGDIIERASIKNALGVIIMWDNVEKSLDVLLTLRGIDIQKIAVLSDPFYARYLHYAGVSAVITPKSIAGARLAKMIMEREAGVLDIRRIIGDYGMMEVMLPAKSKVVGMKKRDVEEVYGIKIIGVYRDGKMMFKPNGNYELSSGDLILVFGKSERIAGFFSGVNS